MNRAAIYLAASLYLAAAAPCQAQSEVIEPERLTPDELTAAVQPCLAKQEPVTFCTGMDTTSHLFFDRLLDAAFVRLADRDGRASVSFVWFFGGEGVGPMFSVRFDEVYVTDDGKDHRTHWVATRRTLPEAGLVSTLNAAWAPKAWHEQLRSRGIDPDSPQGSRRIEEVFPDTSKLVAAIPLVTDTAIADSCPGARRQLDALEPLLDQKFDISGVGRDIAKPVMQIHGSRLTLRVEGRLLATRSSGSMEISADESHPLSRWSREMLRLLEPCWRPAPDDAP